MKKINSIQKFALYTLLVCGIMAAGFSPAEAQRGGRGGRGFSGGTRSFGGGARISGGFGGGNRIAAAPRIAPGRTFGGIRSGVAIRPGYNYRGGYYGRSYYGGGYGRPYVGYGSYYRGYYPYIGLSIGALPFGYFSFNYGGYPYYYNDGFFYRQYVNGGNYQVVAPPVGAEVPRLPRGTNEITIDGQQYYEKEGVYYQKVIDENGRKTYRVAGKDGVLNTDGNVDPQNKQQQYNNDNNTAQQPDNYNQPQQNASPRMGDVVNSIPADSRKVTINGEKLFVSPDGVYYQEDNSGSSRIFKVVGAPVEDGTDTVTNP